LHCCGDGPLYILVAIHGYALESGIMTQLAWAVLVLINNCFSGCESSPFHPITITITRSATFVPNAVRTLLIQAPIVKERWFFAPPRFAQPCLADAASLGLAGLGMG
jgi:hypothetical protein